MGAIGEPKREIYIPVVPDGPNVVPDAVPAPEQEPALPEPALPASGLPISGWRS